MPRVCAPLRGISEIRNFFRTNETPVYFVSATAFNLLGIDRWVRNFRFINYYDSFDGHHPHVFVPTDTSPRAFESIEEICREFWGGSAKWQSHTLPIGTVRSHPRAHPPVPGTPLSPNRPQRKSVHAPPDGGSGDRP